MISDPKNPTTAEQSARLQPRLALKPDAGPGSHVDGGWWPWSTDPATEFPMLIRAMAARSPVRRVSYQLDTWGHAERRLTVDGTTVRMEGFRTTRPDAVTVIGPNLTRSRLLVVPPDTPDDIARAVLRAASSSHPNATVEEILARHGVPATNAAPEPRSRPAIGAA